MSEVIGMESTVDFTKPSSGCVFPQGSGDIIFVFITAGEIESATLKFLNGSTPDDPMLTIPIKVPAGNSQIFDFSNGSLNYYDGLYAILLGDGAQASIKVIHHEI
jgi:hypothetical protein